MNAAENSPPLLRRAAFGLLAAFILLAPAVQQVLGVYLPIFRPWVMYSGVGLGLLRGEVIVTRAEGRERLSPEAFLGVRHYPITMSIKAPHVIPDQAALTARMAAYCAAEGDVRSLSFDGKVSWLDGWRPISAAVECEG